MALHTRYLLDFFPLNYRVNFILIFAATNRDDEKDSDRKFLCIIILLSNTREFNQTSKILAG